MTEEKAKPKFKRKSSKKKSRKTTGRVPKEKRTKEPFSKNKDLHAEIIMPIKPKGSEHISAREALRGQIEILQLEWAIKYPTISVRQYLIHIKGFSEVQYKQIVLECPSEEWEDQKDLIKDRITESLVKRHVDIVAEMHDQFIGAGRMTMAKALQQLTNGVMTYHKKDGEIKEMGRREMYPRELKEVAEALLKSQQMFRTALGLPNDGEGSAQILERLIKQQRLLNHKQNTQINVGEDGKEKAASEDKVEQIRRKFEELSYDEIMVFIDHKRQKLRSSQQEGDEEQE